MTATAGTILDRLRTLLEAGALALPLPGQGETAERHRRLAGFGREDLSLGRLAEAHCDALSILAQAGRRPRTGALYGVWAADRPGAALQLRRRGTRITLTGSKAFCTGVTLCDAALITAGVEGSARPQLIDLDLTALRTGELLQTDCRDWISPAFAHTATGTMTLADAGVEIPADRLVGAPGWYLDRPGFWHGAVGPAAVWAGGALGLIDLARRRPADEPHKAAHLGALSALEWSLLAVLDAAGRQIDADPDHAGRALARALSVRHVIERSATEVLDRFGRATGPSLLAFDADAARRHAELSLYIRQCHGERDLALLYQTVAARETG